MATDLSKKTFKKICLDRCGAVRTGHVVEATLQIHFQINSVCSPDDVRFRLSIMPLNPQRRNKPSNSPRFAGLAASCSGANSQGTSCNCTSLKFRFTVSADSCKAARNFPDFTSANRANNAVTEPNSFNSSAAVFCPTPGTPGMLSTASPISASHSATCSGSTPALARTCSRVQTAAILSFGFHNPICGETNCIKSLSELA